MYVFGTPKWERLTKLHTALYHKSRAYREWRKQYEASDARKTSEALRKRMAYYGVDDPSKLPQKSPRGRKPTISTKTADT